VRKPEPKTRWRVGKIRPVGSQVPLLKRAAPASYPWQATYHTVFMASGTEALSGAVALAMARCHVEGTAEVLVPAYGCPDLVSAILAQGAKPVLVDLAPGLPFMDESRLRAAITARTVAVVGVGFLGLPERLDLLAGLCRESGIMLIEDSAQCFPPASAQAPLADCVVLSFGRGKPINLMGGGALLVRAPVSPTTHAQLDQFPLVRLETGWRWRIKRRVFNLLMARIPFYLLEKLPFLRIGATRFKPLPEVRRLAIPEELVSSGMGEFSRRPMIQALYDDYLNALQATGWERLPAMEFEARKVPRLRYPLLAPDQATRDGVLAALNRLGIGASGFYGVTLPEIEGLESLFADVRCPCAEDFASRLLTLPCHENVREDDVRLAARIILDWGGRPQEAPFGSI